MTAKGVAIIAAPDAHAASTAVAITETGGRVAVHEPGPLTGALPERTETKPVVKHGHTVPASPVKALVVAVIEPRARRIVRPALSCGRFVFRFLVLHGKTGVATRQLEGAVDGPHPVTRRPAAVVARVGVAVKEPTYPVGR